MPPSTPHLKSQYGFSLLELTVTVVMSVIILGVSLSLIATQRRQYLNQQANTDTNQTIQSAMDFIGTDIRQAGEKIGPGLNLPVIRIQDGAAGAPDELLLQRKLLDTALNVCQDVPAGVNTTIKVSDKTPPASSICRFTDSPALPKVPNSISDDVDGWHDFRCKVGPSKADCDLKPPGNCIQNGGDNDQCSRAYIYDPTNGNGDFFIYIGENTADQIQVTATFTHSYPAAHNPQLYLLEQRRYFLSDPPNTNGDRSLNLETIDRDNDTTYQIVNRLRDFQLRGLIANTWNTAFNVAPLTTAPPYADWQTVQSVEVSLSALNGGPDANPTIQTLTSQFFPRNSLSRP
jgi:type II secretory pathway pseudopilin PulG